MKRIKIKIDKNIDELIKLIDGKNINLELDIDENNTGVYKVLSTNNNILDWEFYTSNTNISSTNKKENISKGQETQNNNNYSLINILNLTQDYLGVAVLIKAYWELLRSDYNDTPEFFNKLNSCIKNYYNTANLDLVLIKSMAELYYNTPIDNDVRKNIAEKLKNNKDVIKNCNLISEVTKVLFKK